LSVVVPIRSIVLDSPETEKSEAISGDANASKDSKANPAEFLSLSRLELIF